jgi:thiol-disulfide isomerase/thioredoxin
MTRSRKQSPAPHTGPSVSMIVIGLGALVIAAAAVAAVALAPAPAAPSPAGTAPPSGATAASPSNAGANADLPAFASTTNDAAVGRPIPEVDGRSFDGTPVRIAADGRPKLIVFLAHWCPHCQREVPVVQAWLDANGMPAGVELISVATAIDPNRPNYPPDAWLAREHWEVPVIVDADNQIATRYGLTAFPFWVAVAADGTVAQRLTGELTPDQLDALVASLSSP